MTKRPDPSRTRYPTANDFGRPPAPKPRVPRVNLLPDARRGLARGVDVLANAVRPTLGPVTRLVAIERAVRGDAAELLDDGATIARRIVALPDRREDVGAMLLRQTMWRMHEEMGDGTATLAVLFHSLFTQALKAIGANACNAMTLRGHLEKSLKLVLEALRREATPLEGQANIAAFARTVCADRELADLLGEVFDIVGAEGIVHVESGYRYGYQREYVDGVYWDRSGWCSAMMQTDAQSLRAEFDDPAILISNISVTDPAQLTPILERAVEAGIERLVLVVQNISDQAIGLLMRNREAKTIQTLAVKVPKVGEFDQQAVLQDMAALTGGRVFHQAAGELLQRATVADLGRARRAWATNTYFGLLGGKGDPRALRQHILQVRESLQRSTGDAKVELRDRLGRLLGGAAVLRVGGATESETKVRKVLTERAVTTMRNALAGDIVPGGGATLVRCQCALTPAGPDLEARIANKILSRALEEPLRVIAANAGYEPSQVAHWVKSAERGHGFDARTGQIVDMREAGIMDSAAVLERALQSAVSGAAMLFTTEAVIHRKRPPESIEP